MLLKFTLSVQSAQRGMNRCKHILILVNRKRKLFQSVSNVHREQGLIASGPKDRSNGVCESSKPQLQNLFVSSLSSLREANAATVRCFFAILVSSSSRCLKRSASSSLAISRSVLYLSAMLYIYLHAGVKVSRGKNRWDQAIEDARDTIAKCERKIESMKAAIQTFTEYRDANETWPGQQVTSQSQPSATQC